jgi:hypothetical protein
MTSAFMIKEREARTTFDEVVTVLMMSLKLSLLAKRLDHVSISMAKNISRNRSSATDVEDLLGYYNFQTVQTPPILRQLHE